MKRSQFSEEHVAYALRQAESGTTVADMFRHLGLSEATRVWKTKYAYRGVSELRRLRQLEDENARLKRLVADRALDKHILTPGDRTWVPHARSGLHRVTEARVVSKQQEFLFSGGHRAPSIRCGRVDRSLSQVKTSDERIK